MESGGEGGGGKEEGWREIEFTVVDTAAEALERSEIYYVVKEVIGFVLYMHQQIPAVLQHLENEFESLREECKSLEGSQRQPTELKASSQRIHNMRVREVKQGIRRLEKLMSGISNLLSSLELMLDEIPSIQGLILVLGASLVRPQHVYELFVSNGRVSSESVKGSTIRKLAETLSRKVIRALISKGAGGDSYRGPMKLFLLVQAPAIFNLPQHFLPRRDFRYSKKIMPLRLHIKCKMVDQAMNASCDASQSATSTDLSDSTSTDLIWFQCKHTIKGLPTRNPSAE